ncbi:MAG: thiol peroxidase [Vampirovibrio sp.]
MSMTTQVTFKGNVMQLQGKEIQVGQQAPNFELLNNKLETVTLANYKGKTVFLNVVPSLDTPVCQIQSRQFYQKLNGKKNVEFVTVSVDLPFAQARFCGAENMETTTLSDHRNTQFAQAYGLLLSDLRLLTRAVIIIDAQGKIAYSEIVAEVTNEPNYDAALNALEQTLSAGASA